MITVHYEEVALTVLLLIFTVISAYKARQIVKLIKSELEHLNMIKNKQKQIDEFKKDGKIHKWITIPVNTPRDGIVETQVCEETGFCPSLNGFVSTSQIKYMKTVRETEKKYEEYKKNKMNELSTEYNIEIEKLNKIETDFFNIKKEFYVKKMEKAVEDLKNSADRPVEKYDV